MTAAHTTFPRLFEPLTIGPVTLRNRVVFGQILLHGRGTVARTTSWSVREVLRAV